MKNLTDVLDSQGRYEEAAQMHQQTLELNDKVLGREHPLTLDSMNALSLVLNSQGKYKESGQLQRQALEC